MKDSELPEVNHGVERMADLFSDVAVLLISNGANSGRTSRNLRRIARSYGAHVEYFFSHSSVIITVLHPSTKEKCTTVKNIRHYAVNYSILSHISIVSWKITARGMSMEALEKEIKAICVNEPYPQWFIAVITGLATGALSQIFDGHLHDVVVGCFAGFFGVMSRMILVRKRYNFYMACLVAAFVSTSVVNVCRVVLGENFDAALTACVLWIIPGVHLINGFLDILEGYLVSGSARVFMGTMILFMIAVGFMLSLMVFGYGFFI